MQLKPIVFCDFDGTITETDVTDQILSELAEPAWREIEQRWVRGEIGSRECLERQMALVRASARELNTLIDAVPLAPGFADFCRFAEARALPFYVLSEGFDYVIRRVLKRAGVEGRLRNGRHLFSSELRVEDGGLLTAFPHPVAGCEHGCATCKAGIMKRLGRGHAPIVFIGDGLSDRYAVEAADLVFAKHELLKYCLARGIAFEPFRTFADIQQRLERLLDAGAARPQRARKSKVQSRNTAVGVP
jgi:2-hydroxy-3-keto-5-methylthiopentenyl-1-phosphate phosphatase